MKREKDNRQLKNGSLYKASSQTTGEAGEEGETRMPAHYYSSAVAHGSESALEMHTLFLTECLWLLTTGLQRDVSSKNAMTHK